VVADFKEGGIWKPHMKFVLNLDGVFSTFMIEEVLGKPSNFGDPDVI